MKKFRIKVPITDLHVPRTIWQDIGMATEQKDGSIRLRFRAMPLQPWDGEVVLFVADQPRKKLKCPKCDSSPTGACESHAKAD